MSIKRHNKDILEQALQNLSSDYRKKIIKIYYEIKGKSLISFYTKDNYEVVGLLTGKFSELMLRVLQKELNQTVIPEGSSIGNFADEVRKIISLPASAGNESLRIIIPRAIVYLYTLRNKRGIGHLGGDVQANEIDIRISVDLVDWIFCELIRIFHGLSIEDAQSLISTLSEKKMPVIWEVMGKKRILETKLSAKDQILLLAYSDFHNGIIFEDLVISLEYSNPSVLKSKILNPLHKNRMIEWDTEVDAIFLSPKGLKFVEEIILPKVANVG
ncbi:hypothetical protein [Leptospira wolffii]|uniref:hypothetical protein n=1 Tax=Leptospira wolffii TaxID=409998 RepID=UPI00030F17D0|nr:hypothetical protein [Leptospira wolffii]EPG66443.1 hypothetical protein LEP1GSC061_1029 [Leptospira wolffii serovar Khorat str. Khorat-H2]